MITVNNLTHIYAPGTPLETISLRNINLQISRGEFVALAGPTGSGKSTLAQHFNGLLLPSAGCVLVNGMDTRDKKKRRELWRTVGLVFQYPEQQLFEENVFAEVAFGPRNMGLDRREVERRVRRALEMTGLEYDTVKSMSPFMLSGGQQRRVALAGILAVEPPVLVLDEPAAGLDPAGRRHLLEQIKAWQLSRGTTVILITHNMEDAARYADRMVVLLKGEKWREGTPRQIFGQPEGLHEAGLDLPLPAGVMFGLKEKGLAVRCDTLTLDEAEQEIKTVLPGGK
ncbi:energy-coupling factor transporter ATPase [Desulfotomaculum copahuensis]|uniref:Energy-coupling factor transporter ATP-binding protein EcfA2 n=1 Tax=Desulfotomaculum copahuensis TaxID=1838280 RepID=A0A1B7LDK0_9FIRM|nr:energy-coupling factor transporter ATPase [Desulfotomaculum copahuensis]OAT81174.1 energy-coupling factor transporter ATPase [Desulfotomaculum copahuensis]